MYPKITKNGQNGPKKVTNNLPKINWENTENWQNRPKALISIAKWCNIVQDKQVMADVRATVRSKLGWWQLMSAADSLFGIIFWQIIGFQVLIDNYGFISQVKIRLG